MRISKFEFGVCPACGQIIAPPNPFLNQPCKRKIFEYLSSHSEGASTSQLREYVYGGDPNGGPETYGIISTHISMMRRVLKGSGLSILSTPGYGANYKLIKDDDKLFDHLVDNLVKL